MNDKIAVERIEIRIGKKIISLSPMELKELQEVLDKTFPKKETVYVQGSPVIIPRPVYPEWPWRFWKQPMWMSSNEGKTESTLRLSVNRSA